MRLSPGERLGAYEILGTLGAGGMGEVYRARHADLGRPVAIKVLREDLDEPQLRQRFRREIRIHQSLSHPNLVRLIDGGHQEDLSYLVMELIDGETLELRPGGRSRPLAEIVRFGVSMAAALQHLHARGVVHRDLKPANVFVTREGVLKVSDFGLSRAADGTLLTQPGQVLGTPSNMPPEVLTGGAWEPAGDLYALALILYELLAGVPPFSRSGGLLGMLTRMRNETPPPPCRDRSTPSPELDALLARMLSPDPARRPDVEHVLQILESVEATISGVGGSAPESRAKPAPTRPVMGRPLLGLAALAPVLVAVIFITGPGSSSDPVPVASPAVPSVAPASSPESPAPDAPRWPAQLEALARIDRQLDDASPDQARDWDSRTGKFLWQLRSLVRTAKEEGLEGARWLDIHQVADSCFSQIQEKTQGASPGKERDLELLKNELEPGSGDPYRRITFAVIRSYLHAAGGDRVNARRKAYEEGIRLLEEQARVEGDELLENRHRLQLIIGLGNLLAFEATIHFGIAGDTLAPAPYLDARRRVLQEALRLRPRVPGWAAREGRPRLEAFCACVRGVAHEALQRPERYSTDFGPLARRVIEGYGPICGSAP